MKKIRLIILILSSLTGPASHSGVIGVAWHGYSENAAPTNRVTPVNWSLWRYNAGGVKKPCHILLHVAGEPNYQLGTRPANVYELIDYASAGGGTCFGVDFDGDIEGMYAHLVNNVVPTLDLPFVRKVLWPATTSSAYGDCLVEVAVYHRAYARLTIRETRGQCVGASTPVHCELEGPAVLSHPSAYIGLVRSQARGKIRVTCTRRASVKIYLLIDSVELQSGAQTIRSVLSLGEQGSSSTTVVADKTGEVSLLSTVNAQANAPGDYVGSTVVIATWD